MRTAWCAWKARSPISKARLRSRARSSIGSDRFVLRGTILILDAPDKGRRCERTGDYEFRATGKRKYWRMQKMEACGGLTDYVDVYY